MKLISTLFSKPSFGICFMSILAVCVLHITTPEYLKYWYIMIAIITMNTVLYRPIKELYSSKLIACLFHSFYIIFFGLVLSIGLGATIVPYSDWNPFFRAIITSTTISFMLLSQPAIGLLGLGVIHSIAKKKHGKNLSTGTQKIYSCLSLGMFIVLFSCYMIGVFYGKKHIVVRHSNIEIHNLPSSLDKYRIVLFSDLHAGSMNDAQVVERMKDSINSLQPDMVVYAGDIVTLCTKEIEPFINTLRGIKATDGVFAVLGNHDYSRYPHFPSAEARTADSLMLRSVITDSLGWILLNDEHCLIIRNNDSLVVTGSQYIGLPSKSKFKLFGDNPYSYGNLEKTLKNTDGESPVIFITHNPVVWSREVIQKYPFVNLTLSGHTHAGQMGIYKKKYQKPQQAKYDSKTKAGLYQYNDQYLYISSGIGTSAMHSRFAIFPEVTLITLHQQKAPK